MTSHFAKNKLNQLCTRANPLESAIKLKNVLKNCRVKVIVNIRSVRKKEYTLKMGISDLDLLKEPTWLS